MAAARRAIDSFSRYAYRACPPGPLASMPLPYGAALITPIPRSRAAANSGAAERSSSV
jgi:hypothetical protein